MGTSVPNWKNELSSQGQGDVKTYTLSPEELAEIVGKPIPKSHTKPLNFRARTKSTKGEKTTMKTASKEDTKPAAPVEEVAVETQQPVTQPDHELSKTVLTKAEDEAIFWLLDDWSRENLLQQHAATPNGWQRGTQAEAMNGMSVWKLAQALIAGYTVELTMEEKLKEAYEKHISSDDRKYRGIAIGIRIACEIAGIKVNGINDQSL